jgi:hypothetical protein
MRSRWPAGGGRSWPAGRALDRMGATNVERLPRRLAPGRRYSQLHGNVRDILRPVYFAELSVRTVRPTIGSIWWRCGLFAEANDPR